MPLATSGCYCGGKRATALPLMAFHLLGGFHHQSWIAVSRYQEMPMELLLILEEDLGINHTVHTTVILPCGAGGSHRARHACTRTLLHS